MNRGWFWRLGTVLAVVMAAFVVLWPSLPRVATPWAESHIPFRLHEGLDIRGGARLSYDVQIGQAIAERRNRAMDSVREQLARDFGIHHGESRLSPDEITRLAERVTLSASPTPREFAVRFRNAGDSARVSDGVLSRVGLRKVSDSNGVVTLSLRNEEVQQLEDTAVRQAMETITNRIDELAVKETSITARGETIVVEVPGQDEAYFNQIQEIIRRTARLDFKILDDESTLLEEIIEGRAPRGAAAPSGENATPTPHPLPAGITLEREQVSVGPGRQAPAQYLRASGENARQHLQEYLTSVAASVPEGRQVLIGKVDNANVQPGQTAPEVWRTYTVFALAQVDGSMISDAQVQIDPQDNRPNVSITFTRQGAEVFARVTEENVKRRFAIVLDDRVNSAPVIQQRIAGGQARITLGGGDDYRSTLREANELMVVLRAGALPAPLSEGTRSYIGPTLGADTIHKARNAMIAGIALVLVFMTVYYGWAGFIANAAVLVNLFLQLAALALFGATITLPGLAGLALTVGMSVDNNVLINERIKEEQRGGKSLRASVDAGYNHAFSAIFDGHITTLISGVVLLQYGTGPVKGFAVTLLIGVIANLFTGVFATRVVFDWLVRGLRVKKLLQ
ncbi:MAG: protein translocase subunit SecD [Myxococcales bacterium]|nr:protein translocase subunit SecD [Myxococcales bacterium]